MVLNPSIKKIVPSSGEPNISYDFSDVTRQTGYRTFYLAAAASSALLVQDAATTQYFITPESSIYSPYTFSDGPHYDYRAAYDAALYVTADLQFNVPADVRGDLILNIPVGVFTSPGTTVVRASAAIFHYDGTTETQLATPLLSSSRAHIASGGIMEAFIFPITTIKRFKIGDKLRIKNAVSFKSTSGDVAGRIYHDPANRLEGSNPTQYKIMVPFKIDV